MPHPVYIFNISIHAPTRGATFHQHKVGQQKIFQSTLPRGERPRCCGGKCIRLIISIHAPTRGATVSCNRAEIYVKQYFNPRSHEGSDSRRQDSGCRWSYFNPRSHEGSDSNFRQKVLFSLSKNCLKYLILTTNYFN